MALRKPSHFFNEETEDSNLLVVESNDNFFEELNKIENLSDQVLQLQKELSQKVIKNDLESMVLSQINTMRESFERLKLDLIKSNQKNIGDFSKKIFELTDIIDNLIEVEIPKYKNKITKNEIFIGEKINQIQNNVREDIVDIRGEINNKFSNIAEVIDNNIGHFNQKIQENSTYVKKNSESYNKLSKILESKITKENEKFDEYSNLIETLYQSFEQLSVVLKEDLLLSSQLVEEKFEEHQNKIKDQQINFENSVDQLLENHHKEILEVKSEVIINEQHIKNVDKYLQEYHQELVQIKEEVFSEIQNISIGNLQENIERLEKKIDLIKETYSQIEPEVIIKEVIQESNFTESPETKNSDPLTPLNQNFVTLDQLQQHYRLFLNRIQQQLSTIGGGGETRLKYLDDIVGIATNPSAYDGKYLKYNHSIGKFEFVTVSGGGGGGGESYWVSTNVGIHTLSNVGVGTTDPTSALTVVGDVLVSGIVTATDFNSASDIKLKDNVNVIENPIDKVLKLEGVNFHWKYSGKKSLGVIAQQVEEVLPELVSGDENKTVNYNGIVGLLIECIKEQQKEIDELKRSINK